MPLGVERACSRVGDEEHAVLQRGHRLEDVDITFEFLVWILIAESVDIVITNQSLEAESILIEHHHCHGRIGQGQTDILQLLRETWVESEEYKASPWLVRPQGP